MNSYKTVSLLFRTFTHDMYGVYQVLIQSNMSHDVSYRGCSYSGYIHLHFMVLMID
jgi:hypothetical protein